LDKPLALVTGASRGIGGAVAHALAPTHELLLGGRDVDALQRVTDELHGSRAWPVELTDPEALAAATAGITRLDVLVHSAGIGEVGTVADTPVDVWRCQFEINVVAVAELTRLLLPALRAAAGHIVMINSGAGLNARPGWASYAASKHALRALADSLRAEEAEHGVRVTSVFPGRTATDMQRAVRAAEGGEFRVADYLTPEAVAAVVASAVAAPPDAQVTDVMVRPTGR